MENNDTVDQFDLLIQLCQTGFCIDKDTINYSGNLNDSQISLLQSLERHEESGWIEITLPSSALDISDLQAGSDVEISIKTSRYQGLFFGKNLDDLLTACGSKYCQEKPRYCYLQDEDWKSWTDNEPRQAVCTYIEVVDFLGLLKERIAFHSDPNFLYLIGVSGKLSIPLVFSAPSICNDMGVTLNALATLNSHLNSEVHIEDKIHQFKAVLLDLIANIPENQRCNYFIQNIDLIKERFIHNHELFVSGFAFDDNREELITKNREYTSELNSVINSIHARIVGIPIGTILPALLIKTEKFDTSGLNFTIFLSSLFISIAIAFSLLSQQKLLNKVRREYSGRWARMKTSIPNLISDFEIEYDDLEKCYRLNRNLIRFFYIALFSFLIIPSYFYYNELKTSGAVDKFLSLLTELCTSIEDLFSVGGLLFSLII